MNGSSGECWHCGEPLPAEHLHARIAGRQRPMCCQGCCAAAELIEQLGLTDYYRLRSQPAQKPELVDRSRDARQAWRRDEIARHVVRELDEGRRETMLLVEGLRCSGCVWLIERSLKSLPGVIDVQVNALSRRARIKWVEPSASLSQILERLARTGYRAWPLDARALDEIRRQESRDALKRLLVAGFGAMQAMMFAAVSYLGPSAAEDTSTQELFRWLALLVATPVVFYAARPFFVGAIRSLEARRLGMDIPVAAAIALIYVASFIETVRGSAADVYFDSVSMFVFFLLAGRYLEMRARHRAGDLVDALARLTPPFVDRLRADRSLDRIGIHELRAGDLVHLGEGGRVPADGVLLSHDCRVDEALLSGESSPVLKRSGDSLMAGSVLLDGPVEMRVDRVGAATALGGIAALVERALAERPRLQRAGERATAAFVVRVLGLTVLTAVAWSIIDPLRAFPAAVAVLVVSCPCAFALAVPAAITRALAVLAKGGVLVVHSDAIEALAEATHVVFDKTGTLTEPRLALADVQILNSESVDSALHLAGALARQSHHPIAQAIAAASTATSGATVTEVKSHAGLGISGRVSGRELRLGRPAFALSHETDSDAVLLADESGPVASFQLSERLRPEARQAIDMLKNDGLTVCIASGDAGTKVARIAGSLGVTDWRARQLPADKLAWLHELRERGGRVLAVGDGINDAPVLAGADVAIALSSGAELAKVSSDIVLTGERLDAIVIARRVARQTLTILRQNQRWALFYNLTAVPLAALGLVPPWLAAIGMSLSSLGVILNSQRAGRSQGEADGHTSKDRLPSTAGAT
jgi:P-type Cu2+ transporter